MSITHFERIQICCDDVYQSASSFSKMLGRNPLWTGQYRLLDNAGRVCDHGASVWFAFENTKIELCSSSQRQMQTGIAGVVMGCEPEQPLPQDFQQINAYRCVFSSVDGGVFEEDQFTLESSDRDGFLMTLVKTPWAYPVADVEGDIARVDHLVLYSHDAQTCIDRFGESGLGLRLALDQTVPEWGGRMLFFRIGKLTLEVIVPNDPMTRPDFFWGIAYQTHGLASTHERLLNAGVAVSDIRDGRKPGTRVASLKSGDLGIPTLLLEPAR
ncbi:MAG: hypothetical protein VXZ35_04015 [Pseudomonadota bacterium]|nr:hypothetical protein [Pseudomonadota bacterium]